LQPGEPGLDVAEIGGVEFDQRACLIAKPVADRATQCAQSGRRRLAPGEARRLQQRFGRRCDQIELADDAVCEDDDQRLLLGVKAKETRG
jgi:hypothetical protein